MGPPVGYLDSAGAAFPEPYLHREYRGHQLPVPGDELTHVLGGERRFQHVSVWSLRDSLAGVFVQLRLGIESFNVARSALHEDPDDALGFGGKMRLTVRRGPDAGLVGGAKNPLPLQDGAERQSCKSHATVRQERSAADLPTQAGLRNLSLNHKPLYRMVTNSVWFKSACARFS